jgi:hypothetical protein
MAGVSDRCERLLDAGLALAADLALSVVLQRIVELAADLIGALSGAPWACWSTTPAARGPPSG